MRLFSALCFFMLLLAATFAVASGKNQAKPNSTAPSPRITEDISGRYSFLHEGEYIQLNLEDGKLDGYVSRYGDSDSDRGAFLDQFFTKADFDGGNISFATRQVHGVWFDFKGTVERSPGKTRADEGYFLIRGTLTRYENIPGKSEPAASAREATFKFYPDIDENLAPKK